MYAAYFNFREMPFSILPDPRFLYLSRAHSMALSMLEYGVLNQAGFTVVTGEIGSGKTTLVRHLLDSMDQDLRIAYLNHTPRGSDNLIEWLLLAFDQSFPAGASYALMYKTFCEFVQDSAAQGVRVVLIIDEAQNLHPSTLEELRMLSNVNAGTMILQLVLVGQPELSETLGSPQLRQFAQRVSSDFHLPRLMPREVNEYLDHRISFVGGDPAVITASARRLIANISEGIPRQINVLADRCFAYAYGREASSVTPRIVREVLGDKQRHGAFRTSYHLAMT